MNREVSAVIKTVFDFIDQISENISDLRDRQEKIKTVLLSMLGTIIGLCVYNNYITTNNELYEKKRLKRNEDQENILEEEFREIKRQKRTDNLEEEKPSTNPQEKIRRKKI